MEVTTSSAEGDFPSNATAIFEWHYEVQWEPLTYLSQPWVIVAIILGTLAIGANVLSVCAVAKIRPHLNPHFRLIINLAFSDALIGITVLAHLLNQAFNPVTKIGCAYVVIKALNNTGLNITLLNLFAMAIDHYLAILRPLHHSLLISKSRANLMILSLWLFALLMGFSDFFSGLWYSPEPDWNYCDLVRESPYHEEYTVFAITLASLVFMLFIYVRIYLKVRRRQAKMSSRRAHTGMHRNKRALITTLLILGSFCICWLPTCLFQISMIIYAVVDPEGIKDIPNLGLADRFIYNLLLVNAICDPAIYTMRMCEVKRGYRCLFQPCVRQDLGGTSSDRQTFSGSSSFKYTIKKSSPTLESSELMERLTWNCG